jgi:hypothetical protein
MGRTMLFLVALLVLATFIGCGDGDESDRVTGQTPDLTQREISEQELAAMMVPLKDMGPDYADFELADESGPQSNEAQIESASDREDTEKDIDEFGRSEGYEVSFVDWKSMSRAEGAFVVGTWVDVLKDPSSADGYMMDYVEDMRRDVGAEFGAGTVVAVSEFDVGGIADGSKGVRVELKVSSDIIPSQPVWYFTFVFIRRGRVVGAASIDRKDDKDVHDEVVALARKLNERIDGVLSGQITSESGGSS